MRALLDTHIFLWLAAEPHRLSQAVKALLANPGNEFFLSYVSAWEIAIKSGSGKLVLPLDAHAYVLSRAERHTLSLLPITLDHVTRVATLPHHHRDPFDRLLIAQAQIEGIPIVTADPRFAAYDIQVIPAS